MYSCYFYIEKRNTHLKSSQSRIQVTRHTHLITSLYLHVVYPWVVPKLEAKPLIFRTDDSELVPVIISLINLQFISHGVKSTN